MDAAKIPRLSTEEMDTETGDDVVEENEMFNPRKNLNDLFDEKPANLEVGQEHMKCYLRIRPFSDDELNKHEKQDCLEVENSHSVLTHAPETSQVYRNHAHGLGKTSHRFTFSRIFQDSTTQKEFFNDTMLGLVKDFIDGQNCLVYTYGVTSSGKTYTIQGKPSDAGILPRALDVLFNSINGRQWPGMNLKPKMFMSVSKLSPNQEAEEKRLKDKVFKMSQEEDQDVMSLLGDDASVWSDMSQTTNTTTCSEGSNISASERGPKDSAESAEELFASLNNRVREETAVNVEDQGQIKFSVWVSFSEIYNEQIFDLLDTIPKKKNSRRPVLKLSEDKNGSPYIKGLKEINVTSADEAYKLLTIGQRNLRTACTKLNHNSSRSHCIFNIKILRVVDKDNPEHARVSMLSLCDLAGSERHSKTESMGERLKEAGNINTSLLILGRCIETLRFNQHHKEKMRIIPFRDSKLTRLFQNFFCGRGKAAMIINVNQCASMFDETLHVFKFSAIAKMVVVQQKPEPKRKIPTYERVEAARPTIGWATPYTMAKLNTELDMVQEIPLPDDEEEDLNESESEIEELVKVIEDLKRKLVEERKAKLQLEAKIREEVCKEMMEQLVSIENECSERIKLREQMAEELADRRIQILRDAMSSNPRKRPRTENMQDETNELVSVKLLHQEQNKVQEQNEQISSLTSELELLKEQIKKLTSEQETYLTENSSLKFQMETMKQTLEDVKKGKIRQSISGDLGNSVLVDTLTHQLREVKEHLKEKENEIEELNEMLAEAGETFHQKESEIEKFKASVAEDEEKLKQQAQALKELQNALAESKSAIESADSRMTGKDDQMQELISARDNFQGTSLFLPTPESPSPATSQTMRKGSLNYHVIKKSSVGQTSRKSDKVQKRSQDCPPPKLKLQNDTKGRFDFKVNKPLDQSRVLQLIVTPLPNTMITKHTKTSLLRLKNSPVKKNNRDEKGRLNVRECVQNKENEIKVKRKLTDDQHNNGLVNKKRRVSAVKKRSVRVSLGGRKYNLRNRP